MVLNEALSKLGGKAIPSGNYNTIINNEAMVSIVRNFC